MDTLSTALLPSLDTGSIQPKAAAKNTDKIDAAAKDFESVFLAQMLQHMFEGVGEESDAFGGDPASNDIYRSWMVEQYSTLISDSGGVGVADHVKKELLKLQEVQSAAINQEAK